MTSRRGGFSLIGIMMIAGLTGCGLQNLPPIKQPTQPITILFIQSPPVSLAINATANVDAAVENSPSNGLANYTVTCASTAAGACGTFAASDELGAVVYVAPPAIPSGGKVTLTATAAADATKSVSAVITITAPIPIVVAFAEAIPASLQVNATVDFFALIENDTSANPQVKWTLSCGDSACGSLTPTTTGSFIGTVYTAPSTVPPGNIVTVTATSVTDPTKSVSANITIIPQGPTLANGTYVFQLSGAGGQSASFTTGVVVALNGTITGGEQDTITYSSDGEGDFTPYAEASGPISGGSYGTTPDGNLQITISVGEFQESLNGVLTSDGKGFVGQIYGSQGSGALELQTSTAAPAGGYAFSMYGGDQYGVQAAIGGIFNIDSAGGISGNGSVMDCLTGGYLSGTACSTLAASTVSPPDKYGRVQIVLNPGATSAPPVQSLVGYIVDSAHIRLISTPFNGGGNNQGVMGGLALGQGADTGKFSNSSIADNSYVFGASTAAQFGEYQVAGAVTANANGALTGALNWNQAGGNPAASPLAVNGTWAIDSTGRATLTGLIDGSAANLSFNDNLHLYLTGDGNALLMSSEYGNPFVGQAFQQQAGALNAASFSGNYGLNAGLENPFPSGLPEVAAGSVTSVAGNGTDTLAGFADWGNGAASYAIAGSLTASSNGVLTGSLTGLDETARTQANSFTFYLVDNTRAVAIETDSSQVTLGYLELRQ